MSPQPSVIHCSPKPGEVFPEDASRKSGPLISSDEATPPLHPHGVSGEQRLCTPTVPIQEGISRVPVGRQIPTTPKHNEGRTFPSWVSVEAMGKLEFCLLLTVTSCVSPFPVLERCSEKARLKKISLRFRI